VRSLHLLKRIANAPPVLNFPMIAAPFTFERLILRDMGRETANLHLATSDKRTEVLRDLTRRKPDWLVNAAQAMSKATEQDWESFRSSQLVGRS